MTREDAEKRALELWPPEIVPEFELPHGMIAEEWDFNEDKREAYLQCYDDLSEIKDLSKTCGFCVKESKEEEVGHIVQVNDQHQENVEIQNSELAEIAEVLMQSENLGASVIILQQLLDRNTLQDNELRKAAEKIILALDDYGRKICPVEYGLPVGLDAKDFESKRSKEMLKIVTDILNGCYLITNNKLKNP